MSRFELWTPADAAHFIAVPTESDDKYSRGVLGVITGSSAYPGAAVLGVDAALHTGVGMLRYLGPARAADFVLTRRPESVTAPGRVQAWLLGSGMDAARLESASEQAMLKAVAQNLPTVLDGGALGFVGESTGPTVITPHFRELSRVTDLSVDEIAADPATAAERAADSLGVIVVLKGHTTYVADPAGTRLSVLSPTTWLATAGTGDALGGILGALVTTHAKAVTTDAGTLARVAATASLVHGLAAQLASAGGPFTVLDLVAAIPLTIARLLSV
jgi:hydroxyethylthiazole kinase-like uncharacterized protein yjeF